MKFQAAYRYQLSDYKKSLIVYYGIVIALFCIIIPMLLTIGSESVSGSNGVDTATTIFLFVCALNAFKEPFGLLMQNGVSRKTMFTSRLAVMGTLAVICAAVDGILFQISSLIAGFRGEFYFDSIFQTIYAGHAESIGMLQLFAETFLFDLTLYLSAMALGYFITILYYRLGKGGKIALSIAVPAALLFGPWLDILISGGVVLQAVLKFLLFCTGFESQNPVIICCSFLVLCGLFTLLARLFMRRAVVKEV